MLRGRVGALAVTLGLAFASPVVGVVAGSARTACAATDQRAALVVDTGARISSYCVALGDGAVSGIELIRLANDQYGLAYTLGFGGRAVCSLDGVGVAGSDCFSAYPDFWGYWRGDGSGGWSWSGTGGAETTVVPGDVEGWAWGAGQDAATHPAPPATRAVDVCPAASPSPVPSSGGGAGGGGGGAAGSGGSGAGAGTSSGGGQSRPAVSPTPTASPRDREREPTDRVPAQISSGSEPAEGGATQIAAGRVDVPRGGVGAGGLLAAGAIVGLGLGGFALIRRRRRAGP